MDAFGIIMIKNRGVQIGMKYGGYMGKVLKIDLSTRETSEYPWSEKDRELYLGGKIMAAKILYDNVESEVQALSPENYLVITTGPLSGTGAPSSSRFNISGVSPLTGLVASSNCGGNFGLNLKKAGYGSGRRSSGTSVPAAVFSLPEISARRLRSILPRSISNRRLWPAS
jgi:hypothetical protein